ncbi:hypothetical protein ACIP5Y_43410 [Nocardia sp. NPDC088792]|uniref:DUF7373 family lipoprotein n=1 Tax=Nocardia sp. NPDC088792 TaxID=3364332 RepID=UPI00380694E1
MRYSYGRLRSARIRLRAAGAAVLAVSVLAGAGCGSESHAAKEQTIDLSKLDTGSYATKPKDATTSDPAATGRVLEGVRLGNVLPLASEIDPTLSHSAYVTNLFTDANSYDGLLKTDHFATDTPGFITGFATSGRPSTDGFLGSTLYNAVMIFDSDADATSAAAALAHSGFAQSNIVVEPLQSDQHPAAQIIWTASEQMLASWYPTGRFVIFTMIDQVENRVVDNNFKLAPEPPQLALADKAIDVTVDRLKKFQPTPPDKLAQLPLDPDGMRRLTLPRPPGDQTENAFTGTLDRHGALHTVGDTAKYQALFDRAGADAYSFGAGYLIRTRDTASAQTFLDTGFASKFRHPIDPPTGLPIAQCTNYHGPDDTSAPFICSFAYGRYVATVWSRQKQDAYQRISAQYAILANNK